MGHGSLSVDFGFGFQLLLLGGDLRFHFSNHFRQQLFAFLLAVGIDVAGVLFAVRPDGGIPPFPELLIDLGDTARASLAPLALVGLKCAGGGFPGRRRSVWCCWTHAR